MAPKISYQPFLRLAQSRGPADRIAPRCFQTRAPVAASSQPLLRRFSTSPAQCRESRPLPDSSNPEFVRLDSLRSSSPTAAASSSSSPPSPTPATNPHQQQPTPPPPPLHPSATKPNAPRPRRRLASHLALALPFLLVGAAFGLATNYLIINPPAPPEPGSPLDQRATQKLHSEAARLAAQLQLDAEHGWEEAWDAYESLSAQHRAQHLAAGALAGSRGVGGYQRVWRHRDSGTLQALVHVGAAAAGWPTVVHGGVLATLLDEACGRAAFRGWGGRAGLTAKLDVTYLRPTRVGCFYLVRSRVVGESELPVEERGKGHYKLFVEAAIVDPRDGKENVKAKVVFVAPKAKGKQGKDQKEGGSKLVWDEKAKEEHLRF